MRKTQISNVSSPKEHIITVVCVVSLLVARE